MPRRKEINKRKLPGDPVYNSGLVTRTINYMMRDGKKSLSPGALFREMQSVMMSQIVTSMLCMPPRVSNSSTVATPVSET